jgi:ADP-heptose:LPS heptosyltransferase
VTVRRTLKALERTAKRGVLRGAAALLGRADGAAAPDWAARPYRVLFLRHDRIGDMILSTGVLRAIAASHPTLALDVLASPVNAPVLAAEPYVRAVVIADVKRPATFPGLVRRLRRARYDAVVDCMVTAPSLTTLLLVLASGAPQRIGVARRGNDFVYTLPVEPRPDAVHIVEHLSALVAAFGVDPRTCDVRPRITLLPDEAAAAEATWHGIPGRATGRRLLVNVSSGKAARHWPDERFVAALHLVRERAPDVRVALIGAPHEAARAAAIARAGEAAHVATPSIRHALALVATSHLVFTPDTSIAHAASAFGKPGVALFLDGKPPLWRLYGVPGASLASPDQTLASLPLGPVLEALSALLGAPREAPARHGTR